MRDFARPRVILAGLTLTLLALGAPALAGPAAAAVDADLATVARADDRSGVQATGCGGTSPLVNHCGFNKLLVASMTFQFDVTQGVPYTGTLDGYVSTSTGTLHYWCSVLASVSSSCQATQTGLLFVGQRATVNVYSVGLDVAPTAVGDWYADLA